MREDESGSKAVNGTKPTIGILPVGDAVFAEKYKENIASLECYAKKHGYDYHLVADKDYRARCPHPTFFFRKHCAVAAFLESKPPGYVAFVFDMDVVMMNSDLPLDRWVEGGGDVAFYDRVSMGEVMAGNYMAKNTPFAREFLNHWASYEWRTPPGFSSADNGAIHLVLMDAIRASTEAREECTAKYSALTALVDNMEPYMDFVRCTRKTLHPPRTWTVPHGGKVTVWPHGNAWVMDGYVTDYHIAPGTGVVFFHGIKNMEDTKRVFDPAFCAPRPDQVWSKEHYVQYVTGTLHVLVKDGVESFLIRDGEVQPCVQDLLCNPLDGEGGAAEGEMASLAACREEGTGLNGDLIWGKGLCKEQKEPKGLRVFVYHDKEPSLYQKLNFATLQLHFPKGTEFVVLTPATLKDWSPDLPDGAGADLARLAVLSRHGGVVTDLSFLMARDLPADLAAGLLEAEGGIDLLAFQPDTTADCVPDSSFLGARKGSPVLRALYEKKLAAESVDLSQFGGRVECLRGGESRAGDGPPKQIGALGAVFALLTTAEPPVVQHLVEDGFKDWGCEQLLSEMTLASKLVAYSLARSPEAEPMLPPGSREAVHARAVCHKIQASSLEELGTFGPPPRLAATSRR